MARKTVTDLFIHELSDIYSAEKQITRALPRMARAATNPLLAQAFNDHLEETQGQIERIDTLIEVAGIKLKRMKCVAMEGWWKSPRNCSRKSRRGQCSMPG